MRKKLAKSKGHAGTFAVRVGTGKISPKPRWGKQRSRSADLFSRIDLFSRVLRRPAPSFMVNPEADEAKKHRNPSKIEGSAGRVQICSDLFRFVQILFRFVQICSDLFRFVQILFRFCSDLFRICSDLFRIRQSPLKQSHRSLRSTQAIGKRVTALCVFCLHSFFFNHRSIDRRSSINRSSINRSSIIDQSINRSSVNRSSVNQ